jgi:hypothetical protein
MEYEFDVTFDYQACDCKCRRLGFLWCIERGWSDWEERSREEVKTKHPRKLGGGFVLVNEVNLLLREVNKSIWKSGRGLDKQLREAIAEDLGCTLKN